MLFHAEAMHASGAEICHKNNAQQVMTQQLDYSHSHNDLISPGDRLAIDEAVKNKMRHLSRNNDHIPSQRQESIETGHRQRIRQVS
jgi:hypothetical protein